MKVKVKKQIEVEVEFLEVKAGARYWEDSEVNGVEDTEGDLIPCRVEDYWCPKIHIDSGKIVNWEQGKTANIHYKVCDDGVYKVIDINGEVVYEKDGYVPDCLSPKEEGFGDYIIMDINENGIIKDWKFKIGSFVRANEEDEE